MSATPTGWTTGSVYFDGEVLQQIDKLIVNATERVTIVTPYVDLWEHLKNKIEAARRRKVDIIFLVRNLEDERDPKKRPTKDVSWLSSNGAIVIQVPNLHAKIYMNEKTVILSSMNITEPSIANSRDFAVMLRNDADVERARGYVADLVERFGPPELSHDLGKRAASSISSLMKKIQVLEMERTQKPPPEVEAKSSGSCIRCGLRIPYDMSRPLCDKDFAIWQKYKNRNYVEKYCHSCGKERPTSFAKPLCPECYGKS